jgi:hypothetical protein
VVPALDLEWRTIWIVDAHRSDGKRFAVHAAFLELVTRVGVYASHSGALQK